LTELYKKTIANRMRLASYKRQECNIFLRDVQIFKIVELTLKEEAHERKMKDGNEKLESRGYPMVRTALSYFY